MAGSAGELPWWQPIAGPACRLLFQNLLLEQNESILRSSQQAWSLAITRVPPAALPSLMSSDTLQVSTSRAHSWKLLMVVKREHATSQRSEIRQ